jgi:hypothetical protein
MVEATFYAKIFYTANIVPVTVPARSPVSSSSIDLEDLDPLEIFDF